jgi:hypothetical protein
MTIRYIYNYISLRVLCELFNRSRVVVANLKRAPTSNVIEVNATLEMS